MAITSASTRKITVGVQLTPLIVAVLAFCITFILQTQLVYNFGVNTPILDEWEDYPAIQAAYKDGSITLQQMFVAHNEHRPAMPRLITLGLFGFLHEWSPVAAMYVSTVLVSCTAAVWAYTVRRLGAGLWVAVVSAILLASPIQYQNITWGFQTCFYVLTLCVVVGVCSTALARSIRWQEVVVAMFAASCATFSLAAGLLLWPILGLCMLVKARLASVSLFAVVQDRSFIIKLLLYAGAGCTQAFFYMQGIVSQPQQPIIERLPGIFAWSAMALGYPLVDSHDLHVVLLLFAAVIMWLPTAFVFGYYIKSDPREKSSVLIVLLGLASFLVLVAFMIGFGRPDLSLDNASRYTTLFLWNTLLALFACDIIRTRILPFAITLQRKLVFAVFAAALLEIHMLHAFSGLQIMAADATVRRESKQMLIAYLHDPWPDRHLVEPIPYPWADRLKLRLDDPRLVDVLPPELTR